MCNKVMCYIYALPHFRKKKKKISALGVCVHVCFLLGLLTTYKSLHIVAHSRSVVVTS